MSHERVVPFHCPYCAEEDLRPLETHGQWMCTSCRRAFALKFLGLTTGSGLEVTS
ncbi:Insertion element protein [Sporichthya sp.]|uniref:Insertion element protein n=1 Tax=Sporichthya sp. TaxID=65475 RepID=UPI00345BE008